MSNEASYIDNAQMENEELSEPSPSYANKAKKAVAAAVGTAYVITQLGCAPVTHFLGISEEGKLYKEVNAMSTWPGPGRDNRLAPRFDELNHAVNENKYNLDSLKVYQKAAKYLIKAKESRDRRNLAGIAINSTRAQLARKYPNATDSELMSMGTKIVLERQRNSIIKQPK